MGNKRRFSVGAGALVLAAVLAVGFVTGTGMAQTPMGDMPGMPATATPALPVMGTDQAAQAANQAPVVIAGPVTPTPAASQSQMASGRMAMGALGSMGCGMMGRGTMGRGMMRGGMMMGQSNMGSSAAITRTAATAPVAVPADLPTALETADAPHGQQLTQANGCAGCHALAAGQMSVGPTWEGLATTAARRVAGQKAEDYLYTSIVQPNAYVVPGYRPNVMVQTYGQTLAADELANLVKYLLTLRG